MTQLEINAEMRAVPTLFFWKKRAVKLLDDGTCVMSAADDPQDFDFSPETMRNEQALAFWVENGIVGLEKMDENRILVRSIGVDYVLTGDPMVDGRIDKLERNPCDGAA